LTAEVIVSRVGLGRPTILAPIHSHPKSTRLLDRYEGEEVKEVEQEGVEGEIHAQVSFTGVVSCTLEHRSSNHRRSLLGLLSQR